MKNTMECMKLKLTDAQLRNLAKGKGVMVKPSPENTESAYDVWCDPKKAKKMKKAMTKGKGMCLRMTPEELKANDVDITEGGRINWRKIGKTLRSTAKAVGKLYREEVRPEVGPALRRIVKKGIEKGVPFATSALATALGQPELAAATQPFVARLAADIAEPATRKLGKVTGAFGLKTHSDADMPMPMPKKGKGKGKGKAMPKKMVAPKMTPVPVHSSKEICPVPYKAQLQNNYSNFLNPNHPGMNPALPPLDNSLPIVASGSCGRGIFVTRGRGVPGSPMDPLLPPQDNSQIRRR